MNAWTEILTENEADGRATLLNESCFTCGVTLVDHYGRDGRWLPCVIAEGEGR